MAMIATLCHLSLPTTSNIPSFPLQSKSRNLSISNCLSLSQPKSDHSVTAQTSNTDSLRILFAAGGTGGHIYPAVAIADELKFNNPTAQILFLGSPNSMESAAIPSSGYLFTPVPPAPLARPLLSPKSLLLPYHLIKSLASSYRKILDFKPHIVVRTGGYVSFPVCLAAYFVKGVKLIIQEQNSVPGIANWVLSLFADVVFVAFNSTVDCFPRKRKCLVCGNPVRLALKREVSKEVGLLRFFPRAWKIGEMGAKVVLVLGGSLGANAINIEMLNLYYQMLVENENMFIIWQTGVEAFDEMESLVKNHSHLHLTPFMHSMDLAYAAADLIISRAGAMTCSEILATGKPSILIPSPNVAEGHQVRNASLMADLAGSKVIREDQLDSTTLAIAILEILGDESKMAEMSDRALKAAKPNASAQIVQHIFSLVNMPTAKEKIDG